MEPSRHTYGISGIWNISVRVAYDHQITCLWIFLFFLFWNCILRCSLWSLLSLGTSSAVARVIINDKELESWKRKVIEEFETKQRYHVEASRRTHDYDPLITEFIKMLAINGQLPARLMRRPSNGKSVTGHKRKPHRSKAELQKKKKSINTTTIQGDY